MANWDFKLELKDVFHNEDLSFEEKRDEIVDRINSAPFMDEDDGELVDIVEELAGTETIPEFDRAWSWFYDWADFARVWVETQ